MGKNKGNKKNKSINNVSNASNGNAQSLHSPSSAKEQNQQEQFDKKLRDLEDENVLLKLELDDYHQWKENIRAAEERVRQEYFASREMALNERENALEFRESEIIEKAEDLGAKIINQARQKEVQISEDIEKKLHEASEKLKKAEEEAKRIIQDAQDEGQRIKDKARDEAEAELAKKKIELEAEKKALENERKDLKRKKEELTDAEDDLAFARERLEVEKEKLEQRWQECSPDRVRELERDLQLIQQYVQADQKVIAELQEKNCSLRNTMLTSGGQSYEALVAELERTRGRADELADRLAGYPSEEEIMQLKLDATETISLREANHSLRSRLIEAEARASRLELSSREIQQVQAEVSALRMLNDELRQQLIKNKEMLEARSGERFQELVLIDMKSQVNRAPARSNRSHKLHQIVDLVIRYAASREKPIYYTPQVVRSFLAGLNSTRLAILQGLSGTGKTSLPRVFADAIMGHYELISVQSCWRDRHELLGYDNDFDKRFRESEFTKALYRMGLPEYQDRNCFIVLDEMNLARVEYYFADFLSVLEEPENDKHLVPLTSSDPRVIPVQITQAQKEIMPEESRQLLNKLYDEHGKRVEDFYDTNHEQLEKEFRRNENLRRLIGGPRGLVDGHKLRVPPNVWFVGTANKDETTFEISDKVYDRSQIIEFRKRQEKDGQIQQAEPVYVSYPNLKELFQEACSSQSEQAQLTDKDWENIKIIDGYIGDQFSITFGNRIKDQLKIFVPVYVAAGGSKDEAFDLFFAKKILRKLEGRHDYNLADELTKLKQELRGLLPDMNLRESEDLLDRKIKAVRGSR